MITNCFVFSPSLHSIFCFFQGSSDFKNIFVVAIFTRGEDESRVDVEREEEVARGKTKSCGNTQMKWNIMRNRNTKKSYSLPECVSERF